MDRDSLYIIIMVEAITPKSGLGVNVVHLIEANVISNHHQCKKVHQKHR